MFKIIRIILIAALVIENDTKFKCPSAINTCERGKISFYFFKELLEPYEELILGDENSIKNATFIPGAGFKILIHGYNGSKDKPRALVAIRNEYLKLKKFNILVVDWGVLAVSGCYLDTAFPSISLVGNCCAEMINSILQRRQDIKDQFHIVSWSMGAHVSARFAVHFRPKIIDRITGLDPAFPKFFPPFTEPHNILNRNHAKFVDAWHSNMGEYGVYFSNAHYDIYVNQGTFQNGCDWTDVTCHHRRTVEMFAESINPKTKFIARKCEHNGIFVTFRKCDGQSSRRIEIGENCLPPANEKETGTYHIRTNDHPPYARKPDKDDDKGN